MARWHGYILVSDLPLRWTQTQRRTAWESLRGLGTQIDVQPARMNHVRERLDGRALIVEADFDTGEITRDSVAATVANAQGTKPATVTARLTVRVFAPGQSWAASRAATQSYLRDRAAAWEPLT
jgi:hypothetical protein